MGEHRLGEDVWFMVHDSVSARHNINRNTESYLARATVLSLVPVTEYRIREIEALSGPAHYHGFKWDLASKCIYENLAF